MNIKITLDAPELAKAIESLANALGGAGNLSAMSTPVKESTLELEKAVADNAEKVKKEEEAKAKAADEAKKKKAAEAKAKKEAEEKAKAAEAKKKAEAEAEKETEEEPSPAISLEVVRGKLAAHAAKGKPQQEEVKAAITELGAMKLTEVKEEDYGKLLELVGVSS